MQHRFDARRGSIMNKKSKLSISHLVSIIGLSVLVLFILGYLAIPNMASGNETGLKPDAENHDLSVEIDKLFKVAEELSQQGVDTEKLIQLLEKAKSLFEAGKLDDAHELLKKAHETLKDFDRRKPGKEDNDFREMQRHAVGLLDAASTLADVGEFGMATELADKAARILRDLEHRKMLESLPPEERDKLIIDERLEQIKQLLAKLSESGINISEYKERFASIEKLLKSDGFEKAMPDLDTLQREIEQALQKLRETRKDK
jgi:tetratricopeptide (TPR) repeat protein